MFRELSWRVVNRRSVPDARSDLLSLLALLIAAFFGGVAWASRQPPASESAKPTDDKPAGKDATKKAPAVDDKCPPDPCVRVPGLVVAASVLWLVLLVASFVCTEKIDGFADFVEFRLGKLPFETIWFGAVGGWLISAQGIFTYNRKWLRSYDYWHYLRPVLGAIIGTLGCLIFIVLNEAATKGKPTPNAVFYDVIALAVGYREESFRKLLEKLFDSIILPGKATKDTKTTTGTAADAGTAPATPSGTPASTP
jgi:hypothetical protein